MTVEDQNDIDGILQAGRIVARVRDVMLGAIGPGITTEELDDLGSELLEGFGARSVPRITYDFPGATCISINEEIAHGIPGRRIIQAGDVVNVDVSAELEGYFAGTGGTVVVPPASRIKARLCHATRLALEQALAEARAGAPINRIGKVVQRTVKMHNFKVVQNLAGHGVGRNLHEEPTNIVSYCDYSDTRRLQMGQVIAISEAEWGRSGRPGCASSFPS